jgi:hypothetical protein
MFLPTVPAAYCRLWMRRKHRRWLRFQRFFWQYFYRRPADELPLWLVLGTPDKFQGKVTAACKTPFSGGLAVGYENN